MLKSALQKCTGQFTANRMCSAQAVVAAENINAVDFGKFRGNLRNSRFDYLAMSPTLGLNEMQRMMTADDPDRTIYKFGFGQSPMPLPKCMVAKLKEYAHVKVGYIHFLLFDVN